MDTLAENEGDGTALEQAPIDTIAPETANDIVDDLGPVETPTSRPRPRPRLRPAARAA